MKTSIFIIILGITTGSSDGAAVLPYGPLNGSICGTVMFRTNLEPTEEQFLSVSWNFSARHIITSLLSSNVTEPEYEGRINLFRATGSLELRDLESSDAGEYTLSIELANGSQLVGRNRLDIHASTDPVYNVSLTHSSTDLVEFNSSVSLFCSFPGSSHCVRWMNGSSEVSASDRVQDGGSNLTIFNVTRYDQGSYSCHVSSTVSNASSDPVNISVSYGPENTQLKVSPLKFCFDKGSNVNLSCSAESKPSAEFLWFLNGVLLPDTGPELRLMDLQLNQRGHYSCQAFNSKTLRYQTSLPAVVDVKDSNTSFSLSGGAIAGIVIACLSVAAAGAIGGYFIYKKRKDIDPEPHSGRTEQENIYVNMPRRNGNKEDPVYENVAAKISKESDHVYEDMSKTKKK